MQHKKIKWILLISSTLWVSGSVSAIEYQYSLFGNGEYSDNIRRVDTDEKSATIYNAGIRFAVNSTESAVLKTNFTGLLGRTFYSEGDLDDEGLKGFEGGAVYTPRDSNFSLTAIDSYSQVQQNRFVTQRIDNTSDVNVIAVLPRYFIRLSGRDRINFEYLYSDVNDREDDSSVSGIGDVSRTISKPAVGYERAISKISQIAFYVSQADTEYDELQGSDYEERGFFLRLTSNQRKTNYVLDVGRAEIETESGETFDGDLLSLSLVRQMNKSDRWSLQYNSDYGNLVNTDVGAEVINVNVNSQAGYLDEVVKQKSLRSQYLHDGAYFDVGVNVSNTKIESLLSAREETSLGGDVVFTFELGQLMSSPSETEISLQLGYLKRDFKNLNIETDEKYVSLRYDNYITSNLLLYTVYRHDFFGPTVSVNGDVKENIIIFGFSYSPLGRIKGF